MKKALIVVDVQNDFLPLGNLAVPTGDEVIPVINSLLPKFDLIIATQDAHPKNHISFASRHKKELFSIKGVEQTLWPDHCVQGSIGMEFPRDLNSEYFDLILRKGTDSELDSYSAFYANDHQTSTGLKGYLTNLGVEKIFICGLATDYCVYYTALDAKFAGYDTSVIINACRGVNVPAGSVDKAIEDMRDNGIKVIEKK